MTKEEAVDLENRVKGFNGDLIPLLKKWELGLGGTAFLLPDGRIAARPQVFDDRRREETPTLPTSAEPKKDAGLAEA